MALFLVPILLFFMILTPFVNTKNWVIAEPSKKNFARKLKEVSNLFDDGGDPPPLRFKSVIIAQSDKLEIL